MENQSKANKCTAAPLGPRETTSLQQDAGIPSSHNTAAPGYLDIPIPSQNSTAPQDQNSPILGPSFSRISRPRTPSSRSEIGSQKLAAKQAELGNEMQARQDALVT